MMMSVKKIRPYQQAALDSVSQHFRNKVKRVLLCAPCGSGKSFMGSNAALMAARNGKRVLWVAHRSELIDQAAKELRATTGMDVGIFQGQRKQNPNALIQVASIQTLIRREQIPPASFVIGDEAHRMLANQWHALLETYSNAHFLYLTATPCRGDGKPMGDLADVIVPTVQPSELIDEGVLTPCEIIAPSEEISKGLAEDPTEAYLRWGNRRKAIFFCQTKEHARRTCERLSQSGIPNGLVTDETPWATRKMIYSKIEHGTIRALVNVMVATEGLDIPSLEVCVIARSMGNAAMYLQAIGRVVRASKGKESGLLIDLKGVVNTFGSPEADRHYHLDGDDAVTIEEKGQSRVKKCASCGSVRTGAICPVCQMAHSTERPVEPEIIPTSLEVKSSIERSAESAAFYVRTVFDMMNRRVPRFAAEAGQAFRRAYGSNPPSTLISTFLDFYKGNLPPEDRPEWWPKDVDLPGKYRVSSSQPKESGQANAAELQMTNENDIDIEEVRTKARNNMQPTAWVICANGMEYTADLIQDKLGALEDFAALVQQELCNVKNLSVKEGRKLHHAEREKIRRLAYVQATVEREVIDRRKRIGRRRVRFLADFFEKAGQVVSDEQYAEIMGKINPQYLQDMMKDESEWEDINAQRSLGVDPPPEAALEKGKTFNVSKVPVKAKEPEQSTPVQVIRRRKVALCPSRPASAHRTTSEG